MEKDLAAIAEPASLSMAHCRNAKAFPHRSSAAVYAPPDDEPRTERAALGDNHKPLFPTYSISKIAGEVVARTMARALDLPTIIARLNVPYGDNGGWPFYHMEMTLSGIPIPVPAAFAARYNPIHEDDIIATIPKLLEAASVPATTVNWCGDDTVSLQDWCRYLGSLVGRNRSSRKARRHCAATRLMCTAMRELVGAETRVDWQDGLRRLAAKFHPELVG